MTELDRLDKAQALVEAVAVVEAEWAATGRALVPVVSVFVPVVELLSHIKQECLVILLTALHVGQK